MSFPRRVAIRSGRCFVLVERRGVPKGSRCRRLRRVTRRTAEQIGVFMKRGFDGIKSDGTNDEDGHGWMRWMVEARDHGRPRPTSQTGSAGEMLCSNYVEGTVCGSRAEDEGVKGLVVS